MCTLGEGVDGYAAPAVRLCMPAVCQCRRYARVHQSAWITLFRIDKRLLPYP